MSSSYRKHSCHFPCKLAKLIFFPTGNSQYHNTISRFPLYNNIKIPHYNSLKIEFRPKINGSSWLGRQMKPYLWKCSCYLYDPEIWKWGYRLFWLNLTSFLVWCVSKIWSVLNQWDPWNGSLKYKNSSHFWLTKFCSAMSKKIHHFLENIEQHVHFIGSFYVAFAFLPMQHVWLIYLFIHLCI